MTRTTEYLEHKGIPFEVVVHPKAFTSIEEARALGIDAHEVVKALLVDTRWGHVLAVIPGDCRLDMKLVEEAVGDHHAHLATEGEVQHDLPEFELGSLPPLGTLLDMPTFVDAEVMRHETVVFAAGSQTESVKAAVNDLFDRERVTVAPLTRHPQDEYV
ncbi:MAG TPA: YbaK/EbsC family protein [Actinomycetota bacterium]